MLTEERRPKCLKDIIGQEDVVKFLTSWVNEYRDKGTADAFLFHSSCGGTGKTSLANALAGELGVDFCFEKIDSSRCDVETVRGMRDDLMLAPFEGTWKIVLIDEADSMTLAAKDAWLSLLERIPKFRLIIFTTNNLPAFDLVWQSRVKLFELKPHSEHTLMRLMHESAPKDRTVPDVVLQEIAGKAKGNARAALQELEKHLLSSTQDEDDTTQYISERTDLPPQLERKEEPVMPPKPKAPQGVEPSFTLRPSSTGRKGFVEVLFKYKPEQAIRDELKRSDFRWSRFNQVWYGQSFKLPARYRPTDKDCLSLDVPQPVKQVVTVSSTPVVTVSTPPAPISGLEVRRTVGKDGWSVIHTGSGMAIGKSFQDVSEADARHLMSIVLPFTDWNKPTLELQSVPGLKERLKAVVTAQCKPEKIAELPVKSAKIAEVKQEPAKIAEPEPVIAESAPNTVQTPAIIADNTPINIVQKVDYASKLRALIARRL